ncbi:hypothetical protein NDU88_001696 [Pleurodeles waltl]|uniref:Uncharacterized protein n=1 Tax=Pleurodeles waltl TaxID=8319 RepID=A0AAV7PBY3_PLEWA|nr:hypothetical protein NDU88_001696 [Pleurodeles waltl]
MWKPGGPASQSRESSSMSRPVLGRQQQGLSRACCLKVDHGRTVVAQMILMVMPYDQWWVWHGLRTGGALWRPPSSCDGPPDPGTLDWGLLIYTSPGSSARLYQSLRLQPGD